MNNSISLKKINNKTNKILKEIEESNLSKFKEKSISFCYENHTLIDEKCFNFEGVYGSQIELFFDINLTQNSEVKVVLNDVIIYENYVETGRVLFYKNLYINDNNCLKFSFNSHEQNNIKVKASIKGELKKYEKLLSNLDFIDDYVCFIRDRLLSKSNDILSITHNIHNISRYGTDKVFSINSQYQNDNKTKNKINYIISNNDGFYIKNDSANFKLDLSGVDDVCILPFTELKKTYNIVYVKNGRIFYDSYDENFNKLVSKILNFLDNTNIIKVCPICSDFFINKLWAKSTNNYWYLLSISLDGDIESIVEYSEANDIVCYALGDRFYVVKLNDDGITLDEFSDNNYTQKLSSRRFLNSDDAFIFNNVLYLVNGFVVQEIEL